MEQRTSARLAGKAAAVAVSPERAAATVKRESISSISSISSSSSSNKRQRSASPSTDAATASHNNDAATNSHNDDAADAAADEMPWGSSWWDKLPAEIRIMIINHNSPLHNFLNGRIGTKKQLESSYEVRATAVAIWVDALKSDWKGDLDLLPDIELTVRDGLCETHTRSMYERLCRRFPNLQPLWDYYVTKPSLLNAYDYHHFGVINYYSLLHIPARHGWFDLLDFEHPITLGWFAIIYGHLALLRHLAFTLKVVDLSQFQGFCWQQAMDHAAASGCLEIVQMLHDAGNNNCTANAMDRAADGGHFDVMQWLHANRREGCTKRAMKWAAENGHLHIVEWLAEHYPSTIDKDAAYSAATEGRVEVLAFLLPRLDSNVAFNAMVKAAEAGHLKVIKWIYTHRPGTSMSYVFKTAVRHGQTHIMQYLLDNRQEFDLDTMTMAEDIASKTSRIEDVVIMNSMVNSLTITRARALLKDADTSTPWPVIDMLETAIRRLQRARARAKAAKAANPKKRKISSK